MAEVAQGFSSPCCGTLSGAGGKKTDENLLGNCGRCDKAFAAPNPYYVAPAVVAIKEVCPACGYDPANPDAQPEEPAAAVQASDEVPAGADQQPKEAETAAPVG